MMAGPQLIDYQRNQWTRAMAERRRARFALLLACAIWFVFGAWSGGWLALAWLR